MISIFIIAWIYKKRDTSENEVSLLYHRFITFFVLLMPVLLFLKEIRYLDGLLFYIA